jgi:hypothetical protein
MMGPLISKTMNVFDEQNTTFSTQHVLTTTDSASHGNTNSHLHVHEHALAGGCISGERYEHGCRISRLG